MGGGFDPNKDYSLAIKQAQQSGASQSTINQLRQERQNKIDSKYGGVDPYKGSDDIMGNRGSSGGYSPGSSTPSYNPAPNYNFNPGYNPAPYKPAPYNPTPYNNPGSGQSSYNPRPAAPTKSAGEYLRDSGGDYSLAIQYARNAGADTSTVTALQQGRQDKINRQYGGVDPYRGNNDIMRPGTWRGGNYSQDSILGRRDQTNQDLLDGKTIYYDRGYGMGTGSLRLDKPWHEGVDYSAEAEKYAAMGDWDAVDDALMRRGHKMWDTGSNGGGRDNLQVWYDLNQKYNGPSAGTSLQDMYMGAGKVYGYGGKDGLDGINDPNYDSLPWQDMLSREEYMNTFYGPQDGYGGYGPGMPGGPNGPGLPGGYDGGGYGSFEDWLGGMGYNDMAEQTKAAIQAAVQQAMNGYNAQIDAVNKDTDELARQAYIAKMQGEKNLDQQLAANGYAGGMADSQRIASEAGYQDRLSQLDAQAAATVAELQRAIQNAQLTGDMQTAQELSGYLQQMQGQWNAYMQNQQQMAQQDYWNQQNMANQDYWNQQQMAQQDRENSYARAMTMLQAGIMPDDYTLNAANINKGVAQQMVQQALMAQTAKAAPKAAPRTPGPKPPAPKPPTPKPPAPKTEEPAKTGNSPALFIVNNPTMTTAQKIDAIERYVKKGPANGGITEEEGLAYLAALGY